MTDINVLFKQVLDEGYDLATVQGRAAFDDALRAVIAGFDEPYRRHAADMIRVRRLAALAVHDRDAARWVQDFLGGKSEKRHDAED